MKSARPITDGTSLKPSSRESSLKSADRTALKEDVRVPSDDQLGTARFQAPREEPSATAASWSTARTVTTMNRPAVWSLTMLAVLADPPPFGLPRLTRPASEGS